MDKENKELNKDSVKCIAEMILNYYQFLKDSSCQESDSALYKKCVEGEPVA